MSREASTLLLDALESMINHYFMDKIQSEMMEGYTSSLGVVWLGGKTIADPSCPLTCLLSGNYTTPIYQETVDAIKGRVSVWGGLTSSLAHNPFTRMMFDMQTERAYEEMKTRKGEGKELFEIHTSTVLATKTSTSAFQWQNLSPIDVKDLKLFECCKGNVLRGTLITVPSVIKGITTFLQDDSGAVIQIAIYNYVPGKMSRLNETEYVRKHLPKGKRVLIAEPFTKIFVDGNRGVRIDNPREFRVEGADQSDISTAREEGNEFYKQKMYHAASESYITGLQNENLVPTLLSNRSQAHIKLEQWPQALADSAASLSIRPTCDKTYKRYHKALAEVMGEHPSKTDVLNLVLDPTNWKSEQDYSKYSGSADGLKKAGNEAFKCQDYERAVASYTSALLVANKDVRAVLSNWAQAALQCDSYHEAVAASAAALRIWADDKAVYRLCMALANLNELELAVSILDSYDRSTVSVSLKDLKSSLARCSKVLAGAGDGMTLLNSNSLFSKFCPDFASGKIETFLHPVKGRGIRAIDAMPKGSLILIESPLAYSSTNAVEEHLISLTFNQERTMNDKSQTLLESTIMQQMERNHLLARRIDNLYDGQASRPLLRVKDLLTSIGVANAPLLLPPWSQFFDEDRAPALPVERVRNIISTNSFGSIDEGELQKGTSLFAALSMFNHHSSNPNCMVLEYSGSSRAVVTCRAVKKGDEMCISYHSDPDVVKRKWGIDK
jgi:tetratricopeptide (TPR) repeat protein